MCLLEICIIKVLRPEYLLKSMNNFTIAMLDDRFIDNIKYPLNIINIIKEISPNFERQPFLF